MMTPRKWIVVAAGLAAVAVAASLTYCLRSNHPLPRVQTPTVDAAQPAVPADPPVVAARQQIGVCVSYDSRYRSMSYPGGDVEPSTGVCTDVVIRALRVNGKDLQRLVHEDIAAEPSAYPRRANDTNIDHRRVPNLRVFLGRHGKALATVFTPGTRPTFQPGDIVTWKLPGGKDHIGLLSDKKDAQGWPLSSTTSAMALRKRTSLDDGSSTATSATVNPRCSGLAAPGVFVSDECRRCGRPGSTGTDPYLSHLDSR